MLRIIYNRRNWTLGVCEQKKKITLGREEKLAKRLYRSRKNSVIAGVCGGIAEHFDIDPALVRIVAVISIFINGIGLIAYIIGWIFIPQNPGLLSEEEAGKQEGKTGTIKERVENVASEIGKEIRGEDDSAGHKRNLTLIGGLILICLGLLFLASNFFPWFGFVRLWPFILVILGVVILAGGFQKRK